MPHDNHSTHYAVHATNSEPADQEEIQYVDDFYEAYSYFLTTEDTRLPPQHSLIIACISSYKITRMVVVATTIKPVPGNG